MTIMNMVGGGGQLVDIPYSIPVPVNGLNNGPSVTSPVAESSDFQSITTLDNIVFSNKAYYTYGNTVRVGYRVNGETVTESHNFDGTNRTLSATVDGVFATTVSDTVCLIYGFSDDVTEQFNLTLTGDDVYPFMVSADSVLIIKTGTTQRQLYTKADGVWTGGAIENIPSSVCTAVKSSFGDTWCVSGYLYTSTGLSSGSSGSRTLYVYNIANNSSTSMTSTSNFNLYPYNDCVVVSYTTSTNPYNLKVYRNGTEILSQNDGATRYDTAVYADMVFRTNGTVLDLITGSTYTVSLNKATSSSTRVVSVMLSDGGSVSGSYRYQVNVGGRIEATGVMIDKTNYLFTNTSN